MKNVDVIILGAGASGLMCAAEAGRRGRKVLILDHSVRSGKKILLAGGGRCNFTNMDVSADHFISGNPHFCKSALSRFTQWDILEMVQNRGIPFEEREHGQLFTLSGSEDILSLLEDRCEKAGVSVLTKTRIESVTRTEGGFSIQTDSEKWECRSLVVATGGLSLPGTGASPVGYEIARQFGIPVKPTRPGLVPLSMNPEDKKWSGGLSGIAVEGIVQNDRISFRENILFTHRGLSGPAILQISSYWNPGESILVNLIPDQEIPPFLESICRAHPMQQLKTALSPLLPRRVITAFLGEALAEKPLRQISASEYRKIGERFQRWEFKPDGTEGYKTAEVTVGGVDCDAISSKTMESLSVKGLYFTGEVLDVTGWLGGYNLQWAWSSGWCAGQVV